MERIRNAWAGAGEAGDPHPEACAHELHRCRNLPEVKKILRQADQEWMEAFLECGGLVAIFDALSALGRENVSTLADAMPQLQCMECLKAVMTSGYGLEYMVSSRGERYIDKLVLGGWSWLDDILYNIMLHVLIYLFVIFAGEFSIQSKLS